MTEIKSLLLDSCAESSGSAYKIVKLIKELKIAGMKQLVAVNNESDILASYSSGFASSAWSCVKLCDLAADDGIAAGVEFKTCVDERKNNNFTVLTEHNIRSLKFDPGETLYIEHGNLDGADNSLIQSWDIIIRVDDIERGASAIIPMTDKKYLPGENLIRVRLDHGRCEAFYVLNILHFYYNTGLMEMILANPFRETVSDIIIPLPPIEIQKQVADNMLQLSAFMNVQEIYCREMTKFRDMAESL